jgi:hypothetical protein
VSYRQVSDRLQPPSYATNKYREGAAEVVFDLPVVTEDPRISFTVMAHPKRKDWAEQISKDIGCNITWDQINDRHDTGLRAIKSCDLEADWHVVVQDDVILCDNFVETVYNSLRYVPTTSPVGFYYGGKGKTSSAHARAAIEAQKSKANWIIRKGPVWGPAIGYPVNTIPGLVRHFRNSAVANYDRRVMRYYESIDEDCWYTFPSLVDHRQEDNPSLCGHDRPNRSARSFLSPQSALEVDWSGSAIKVTW